MFTNAQILSAVLNKWAQPFIKTMLTSKVNSIGFLQNIETKIRSTGWVAANAAYSDFCRKFDDSQILDIMYLFYFADEDWKGSTATKIWDYMYEKFN